MAETARVPREGHVLRRSVPVLWALLPLAGCAISPSSRPPPPPLLTPLPRAGEGFTSTPRINGDVGTPLALPGPQIDYGAGRPGVSTGGPAGPLPVVTGSGGNVSLEFAESDIREVAAQILGTILKLNYTIDPAVKGTATFHTARPLPQAQLLPVLQSLLAQDGAALVQSGNLYRVVPAAAVAAAPSLAGSDTAGSSVVPLRYTSAEDLAKVLQPVLGTGAKIVADPAHNALLVSGEPEARATLLELVRGFDVDLLAGQSYALLPVPQGADPKAFATTLQDAFRSQSGSGLTGLVRVLPMEHVGAVLVVASQPRYVEAARRVFKLLDRQQRATLRSWHVYYLQNSHANDTAYLLQQAFTPNDVTAQPSPPPGSGANGPPAFSSGMNNGGGGTQGGSLGGLGGGGATQTQTGGLGQGGAQGTGSLLGGGAPMQTGPNQGGATPPASPPGGSGGNPLLGGLDQGAASTDTMRIIPNPQNNALLVYATPQEESTIEAMLRKTDILPLQVRIDAIIAEVTLNDQLQYGTQFFFKQGSVNQTLSNIANGVTTSTPGGFVLAASANGVQAALSALQAVTTVHVLSSPEVLVLDNRPALLEVGDLVPYLTQSAQSTVVNGGPIINSVSYRQTGVILQVTPRVNSGGLVTLDVAQEVSGINTSAPVYAGISSPTFSERAIQSRVVVQDGQTVGLAGLILDNVTRSNTGIPFLKDVPLLGLLAGSQANSRSRTELLVLITPHVVHDQRDARLLTEDLRAQLFDAAMVPQESQTLPLSGSPDPGIRTRRALGSPE